MKFYTNVQLIGNQFLVRGVENGRRYEHRDEFFPTLFVKSKKNTKYKTLNGEAVEAIHPGSLRDCREFYKRYDEVDNSEIYGNDRYIYQYISEKYPDDEIKFDISQIKLVTLDIETTSEQGFPNVESCVEEILAITIQDYTTKQIITWGSKPFNNKQKTKYKTLKGETVEAINPGTVRDCREFYKRYDEVEGFEIYGNDRYIYQYISEKYPE